MKRLSLILGLLGLFACGAASAANSPPPSMGPFLPDVPGGIRPVTAAGKNYIYALDATFYEVYKRNANGSVGAKVVGATKLNSIFQPVITKLNLTATYPASTGIKPCPANLATGPVDPGSGLMPLANVACIESAYDSDVYYDPQTKRVWILAHLRPSIGQCSDAQGNPVQAYRTAADPAGVCHYVSASVLKQVLHRYIAVAVSRPGTHSADPEDPANGFIPYILVDDYGDWSQFTVHNGLVLVSERAGIVDNRVHVFGANDLIKGNIKQLLPTASKVFSSKDWNVNAADWDNNKTVPVTLSTVMMYVRQQSDDKVTYLVSGTADGHMVVYGLITNSSATGQMPAPTLVMPAIVSLPETMPGLQKASAAYLNGYLYWGWAVADASVANRSFIRTFRWEAHQAGALWGNVHPIYITKKPASGYLEADIGVGDSATSYVFPIMNATGNGDFLTMYDTYPMSSANQGKYWPNVHYAVVAKGTSAYEHSYVLESSLGWYKYPPHKGGVLDIVTVAVDPLVSGQLILGNAYVTATGGWQNVIAGVKP